MQAVVREIVDAIHEAEAETIGAVLAAHAAAAIMASRQSEQLESALSTRDRIGQAKGIIMERYDVDDVRRVSADLACHQSPAGDAHAVVALISDFAVAFQPPKPWVYRRLHWQAGALAHRAYLEMTTLGLAASGFGCFFDDAIHDLVGLRDHRYQALYVLGLGDPTPDPRLLPVDPYSLLRKANVTFR